MIEVKLDPTAREVRIFGGLCLLFFGAVGGVVLWRPEGLVGAAVILGTAWLVSLIFNSENHVQQLAGVLLPGLFALSGGTVRLGVDPWTVAAALWAVGVLAAAMVWISPEAGRRLYVGWMLAALPIGWTLSHLVLGAVYYLVLTPIGLLMRLMGRDPMHRRFDRSATSYWVERKPTSDPSRHFRQF
jgi:uncharacterized membrane protein